MKFEVLEKGVLYTLYAPPNDIGKIVEMCGFECLDAALDKTPEDEQAIALLKMERRDYMETHCFTKMEQEITGEKWTAEEILQREG